MKTRNRVPSVCKSALSITAIASLAVLLGLPAMAASWSGIQPLKSRRADVEQILGKPIAEPGADGGLYFKVAGGTVVVYFVDAKFVSTKHLDSRFEGTVLEVILQHESSNDTAESLGLNKKKEFLHDADGVIYRNLNDGITYTFLSGKLRTTRFTASTDQLLRARK